MNKIKTAREQLGLFIRQRREEMGHPVESLAAVVGVSPNTMARIESGHFAWDIDTHHKILGALEIKPYFHATTPPTDEDFTQKAIDDPERYHGFYIIENIILHPGQLGIVKLTHPRVFLRFNFAKAFFADFDEWKLNHTVVQWLDPNDKPTHPEEIESVLIDCWNFFSLTEIEEDRLAYLRNEDENEDYETD